jgi:hypothetical protein
VKAAGWVAKGYWRRSRFLKAFWCRFPGERLPRTGTRLRPPGNDIGVVAFHSIESYPRCGVPDRSLGLGRSCLGPSLAVTKLPSPTFAFSSSTHALTRSSVSFGTDHNQYVYVLRCRHCANVHGARLRYSPASMPLLPERRRGTSAGLAVGAEFRARPAKTGPRSQRQARSGRRRTRRIDHQERVNRVLASVLYTGADEPPRQELSCKYFFSELDGLDNPPWWFEWKRR